MRCRAASEEGGVRLWFYSYYLHVSDECQGSMNISQHNVKNKKKRYLGSAPTTTMEVIYEYFQVSIQIYQYTNHTNTAATFPFSIM